LDLTILINFCIYLVDVAELHDLLDGTKDFFASDAHIVSNVGEDGRLDEIALAVHLSAARHQFCALILSRFDQIENLLVLLIINLKNAN
jgi:hypothetical protein